MVSLIVFVKSSFVRMFQTQLLNLGLFVFNSSRISDLELLLVLDAMDRASTIGKKSVLSSAPVAPLPSLPAPPGHLIVEEDGEQWHQ